jgi:hypothetical protein
MDRTSTTVTAAAAAVAASTKISYFTLNSTGIVGGDWSWISMISWDSSIGIRHWSSITM